LIDLSKEYDMKHRIISVLAVALAAATTVSAQSITTGFAGTTSTTGTYNGHFFDLTAHGTGGITVDSWAVNVSSSLGTTVNIQVWYKEGTWVGFHADQSAWTLLGEVPTTSAGPGNPTPVNLGGLVIPQGQTYGIRIGTSPGSLRYSGANTYPLQVADDHVRLDQGSAQGNIFTTSLLNPRGWNGTVNYTPGGVVLTGGCCLPSGACEIRTQFSCNTVGGTYRGDNTDCVNANCPQPATGACCLPNGTCEILWELGCTSQNGVYFGDNSDCTGRVCPIVQVFPPLPSANTNTFPFTQTPGVTMHQVYASSSFSAIASGPITIERIAFAPGNTTTLNGHMVMRLGYTAAIPGATAAAGGLQIPDLAGGGAPNVIGPMHEFYSEQVLFAPVNPGMENFQFDLEGVPFVYDPAQGNLLMEIYLTNLVGGFSISRADGGPLASRAYHRHNGTTGVLTTQAHRTRMTISLGGGTSTCYANCDGSTVEPVLNVDDFTCFINEYAQAQTLPHEQQVAHYANCDSSTIAPALNVDDFTCFINRYAQGCP
jgi:hypothetical protein